MENLERVKTIFKHCIKGECYGCPLRASRECERSMAFEANRVIKSLLERIDELEKQLAEKEAEQ